MIAVVRTRQGFVISQRHALILTNGRKTFDDTRELKTPTCRSFATICSGLYCFLGIAAPLSSKNRLTVCSRHVHRKRFTVDRDSVCVSGSVPLSDRTLMDVKAEEDPGVRLGAGITSGRPHKKHCCNGSYNEGAYHHETVGLHPDPLLPG